MYGKGSGGTGMARRLIGSAALFAVLVALVLLAVRGMGEKGDQAQLRLVVNGVRRAAVTCYAVEGRFPRSLDHLCSHYGLVYNRDRYVISYDAFASNVMPDIQVLQRGESL